uniref:Uncharacterized protein n=1 Tax=Megaselia scalaris TaxID=36166 RepID=T1H0H3_MEGSC
MTRERLEIRREFGLPVGTKLQAPKFSRKQSVGRGMDLDPETQARYQAALDRLSQAPCESKKTRYEQIMDQERIASKISFKPREKVTAPAPVCEPEIFPTVCEPEVSAPKVVELNKMYETYQKDVQKIDEALQTAHLDEEEINELEEQKEFLALELELHKKAVCEQPAMASVCDQRPIFEAESMPSD